MTNSAERNAMLAKTSIAAKELGLDKDGLRLVVSERFGVESRKDLSDAQLADLVQHFRGLGFVPRKGKNPRTKTSSRRPAELAKARALWISGWHLGVVRNRSDRALESFASRTTGVERLEWLKGDHFHQLIEAIKALLEREGGVDWAGQTSANDRHRNTGTPLDDRLQVIAAQWRRLAELRQARVTDLNGAAALACWILPDKRRRLLIQMTAEELDQVIVHFGGMIRKALAAKGTR